MGFQETKAQRNDGGGQHIYKVFSIVEKPGDQKNIWLDIGVARKNRDDSITCKLDALPISGVIQLRHREQKFNHGSQGYQGNDPNNQHWQKGEER